MSQKNRVDYFALSYIISHFCLFVRCINEKSQMYCKFLIFLVLLIY